MTLSGIYLLVKAAHIGLVMLSGSLFLARGLGVLMGSRLPMVKPIRIASMMIDTALLVAAILLLFILHLNPFVVHWLQAKLVMVILYIFFGVATFRLARKQSSKVAAYVAALLCYVIAFSIARAHDPAGMLRFLL
ncbi:MAG: SirB2 family protein [Pseudomonadales bacterium]|nr:SirB2 family protein [Pseudomonadales bacterium]